MLGMESGVTHDMTIIGLSQLIIKQNEGHILNLSFIPWTISVVVVSIRLMSFSWQISWIVSWFLQRLCPFEWYTLCILWLNWILEGSWGIAQKPNEQFYGEFSQPLEQESGEDSWLVCTKSSLLYVDLGELFHFWSTLGDKCQKTCLEKHWW